MHVYILCIYTFVIKQSVILFFVSNVCSVEHGPSLNPFSIARFPVLTEDGHDSSSILTLKRKCP